VRYAAVINGRGLSFSFIEHVLGHDGHDSHGAARANHESPFIEVEVH